MNTLLERTKKLGLKAAVADWNRYEKESWLAPYIEEVAGL